MTSEMDSLDSSARLRVKVVPGSSKSEISGWLGDMLKVRVTAPPEKGKANAALVLLLARSLGLSKKDLEVISGKTSQEKLVEVRGLSISQVRNRLGTKTR